MQPVCNCLTECVSSIFHVVCIYCVAIMVRKYPSCAKMSLWNPSLKVCQTQAVCSVAQEVWLVCSRHWCVCPSVQWRSGSSVWCVQVCVAPSWVSEAAFRRLSQALPDPGTSVPPRIPTSGPHWPIHQITHHPLDHSSLLVNSRYLNCCLMQVALY